MAESDATLPASTRVDRVTVTVEDRDRLESFYRDAIGLEVLDRGTDTTTLGADADPLLELVSAPETPPRDADETGLFHTAFRVPTRAALGDALERIREGWELDGASDHLVSEALYCTDPEGNGVEVYHDRSRSEWPTTTDGEVAMDTLPLDLEYVAAAGEGRDRVPAGTEVGHVHLEVSSLKATREFYVDALGFRVRASYGANALFLAAGEYHHHVGLNTWNGPSAPASGRGLERVDFVLPDRDALSAVRRRLESYGAETTRRDDGLEVADPDGIAIRLGLAD